MIALLLLCNTVLQAQEKRCNTMEYLADQLQRNPNLQHNMDLIEQHTQEFSRTYNQITDRAVVTIPVVFHVLYNTTAQNISDAQINAQLAQLNADFRKLNSDFSLVPSAFQSVAADCEVQFCLAQQTPSGSATTGIERRSTTITGWSSNDACKYYAQGGLDAWNSAKYLNVWSVNFSNGLLGYAQFPGGAAATDGVVLQYNSIGSLASPTSYAPYNKGRTATHEIGHWLNLRHIWGDATCGSDLVSDTPTHNTSNYGCPTYPHYSTCTGSPVEMTMNYMDYTDDGCMQMFTAGQKTRMQALFASGGARVGLLTSVGCQAPSSGGTTCATPNGLSAGSITTSGATLSWTAVTGASSYNVQYKLSSASTWTTTTSTSNSKTLSGLSAASVYNYQVQAVCTSGTSAYSSAASFTTSSTSTTCSDVYESNNTLSAAKSISANTSITAKISSSTDKDYFKFTNTSTAKNIRVTLSNLPYDYDLKLYNSSGTLLATSQNGGTTNETVKYNNGSVGTYYAYVYGYNGVYSTASCYNLIANISSTAYRGTENGSIEDLLDTKLGLMIFPNPTRNMTKISVNVENEEPTTMLILDMTGKKVFENKYNLTKGDNVIDLNMSDSPKGMYLIFVQNGADTQSAKLILN